MTTIPANNGNTFNIVYNFNKDGSSDQDKQNLEKVYFDCVSYLSNTYSDNLISGRNYEFESNATSTTLTLPTSPHHEFSHRCNVSIKDMQLHISYVEENIGTDIIRDLLDILPNYNDF